MNRSQEDLFPWARTMAKLRARACTITSLLRLTPSDSRKIWQDEHGRSSPSGQQPNDPDWYLKTANRRFQAAHLLILFHQAQKVYERNIAYTHAYYHFASTTAGEWKDKTDANGAYRDCEGDYGIPYGRGLYLTNIYTDAVNNSGKRRCELILRKCKSCKGIYLSHINELGGKCPICSREK